ncbi:DEAD/DEAH box helicase [Alkalimonas sp. MEB108]|uniref:DEAD/DEAH box helicase n=1 Tax=Alkalimonas cellulosilytica TaxID=3058395 RepID=A0ABU7JA80_9GAMM|nr:DEAD/DEAH box helicase [Alkalimonas sp. MEB108]MEE2003242.1 DEAD/DEAH box helicase [Alkalimonas sp. MEB108]
MAYTILDGEILANGHPLAPEQLFKLARFSVVMDGNDIELTVSRRPAELRFNFNPDVTPCFTLHFRDTQLAPCQLKTLVEYGYFIIDNKKVFFVSDRLRHHLIEAANELELPRLLRLLRELRREGLISEIPATLIDRFRVKKQKNWTHRKFFVRELYPYQQFGVEWLTFCARNGIGTLLADDMGLGKTAQVIALCCNVLQDNPNGHILIVVPNPLLDNWLREFRFFAPELHPYLHYGSHREGLSSLLEKQNIILTPYTTLASDIAMLEELAFDLVLYDEASMLKNPSSGRSLAARRLDAFASVAMSGTPVENSLMDAWALCDLVFPNYLGNEQDFRSRYVHRNITYTLKSNLDELEQSLQQITLRRMKKDVLGQLPEKIDIHTAITAGAQERRNYDALIDAILQDAAKGGGGILPLINKLQQYTAHPALLDAAIPRDVKSLAAYSAKFELLLMTLDNIAASGEKVIIFATFQKVIDLVHSAIREKYGTKAGVIDGRTPNEKRQSLIDDFSSSAGFSVLLLHPKTAGMGLNITAATHVIHYCRQWNPALEEQATARAWRNGQQSVVSVHYLYYANTIEEMIDERLRLKQTLSEQVVTVTGNKETDKQLMLDYLESLTK